MLSEYELQFISELIGIPSVGGTFEEGAPYGTEPRKAHSYFLTKAEEKGFKSGVIDDKVGWIEIGSGSKLFGIVCHLDVVPEGSGWNTNPFELNIKDNKMYGRGIVDDKGPACAAYFAMLDLKDAIKESDLRVRLILGTDEERTCECVETYAEKGEIPFFSITPDAEFPVIFAEKGILHVRIYGDGLENITVTGGNAANMVCPEVNVKTGDCEFNIDGKMAHGSRPELGINAIDKLPDELISRGIDINNIPMVMFIQKYMKSENKILLTGCDISDDSGVITTNSGILRINSESSSLTIDIRYPISAKLEDIMNSISKAASEFNLKVEIANHMEGIYQDKNAPEVKTLTNIWKNHMSKISGFKQEYISDPKYSEYVEPIAIGGGTYARHLPNTIAFGVQAPWHEDQCHQANESFDISDFCECKEMIKDVILSLK